jgi:molybdenum cofactor cytidylyltransferase
MGRARVAGLIVAAGLSSRMRGFKPLLELCGKTVIETAAESLLSGGIDDLYAVSGYRARDIEPLLTRLGVKVVYNRRYAETDMFESVRLGLKEIRDKSDAFFLLPGDVPLVRPYTLRALVKAWAEGTSAVLQPVYQGRRGHPPLIDRSCYDAILGHDGTDGLRGALSRFSAQTEELELPDPGLVMDADTPDDYAAMCRYAAGMRIPSPEVCAAIWKWFGVPERTKLHCRAVAEKAKELAQVLAKAGHRLDERLLEAAALLHDLAKGLDGHPWRGQIWLEEMGYPEVARVVGAHTDLPEEAIALLDERAVVYLVDKLIRHDKEVTLDERFQGALDKWAHDPEALCAILRRKDKARRVEERIKTIETRSACNLTVVDGKVPCRGGGDK